MRLILTPDDPEFAAAASSLLPQFWGNKLSHCHGDVVWCVRSDSGLIEPLSHAETLEYLEGGEYEERLSQIEPGEEIT
ncbi:MAG: hypothetical protein ACFE0J_22220 [Elainellaceae cyanobacterium]